MIFPAHDMQYDLIWNRYFSLLSIIHMCVLCWALCLLFKINIQKHARKIWLIFGFYLFVFYRNRLKNKNYLWIIIIKIRGLFLLFCWYCSLPSHSYFFLVHNLYLVKVISVLTFFFYIILYVKTFCCVLFFCVRERTWQQLPEFPKTNGIMPKTKQKKRL